MIKINLFLQPANSQKNSSVSLNNHLYNKLLKSNFHHSVCLYSDSINEQELLQRIKNLDLKQPNIPNNEEYLELTSKINNIKMDDIPEPVKLSDFQDSLNSELNSENVPKISDQINNYMTEHSLECSTFEEAFPDYYKKNQKELFILSDSISEPQLETENNISKFSIIKQFFNLLNKCKDSNLDLDCLQQLNLTEIIRNVQSKVKDEDQIQPTIEQELNTFIDFLLDKIANPNLKDTIIEGTELYNKIMLEIDPQYLKIGSVLLSYNLLVRAFKRYVLSRPIPSS